jgi:hypothetical protein
MVSSRSIDSAQGPGLRKFLDNVPAPIRFLHALPIKCNVYDTRNKLECSSMHDESLPLHHNRKQQTQCSSRNVHVEDLSSSATNDFQHRVLGRLV